MKNQPKTKEGKVKIKAWACIKEGKLVVGIYNGHSSNTDRFYIYTNIKQAAANAFTPNGIIEVEITYDNTKST